MSSPELPIVRTVLFGLIAIVVSASSVAAQCDPLEVAQLIPSDGAIVDEFGASVSIDGDRAIVGAKLDDDLGGSSGSAYIFERVSGSWTQVAKLTASDGAALDWFGVSVALDGDTAAVGAFNRTRGSGAGAVYVFQRTGGVWAEVAKLTASDGVDTDGFGECVSIRAGVIVAGAPLDDEPAFDSGSAYVFERIGEQWTEIQKLRAPDGAASDNFGCSIGISGDRIIAGAYGDDDLGSASGSAYVFEKVNGVWVLRAKLLADDGAVSDYFGWSVSISGSRVLVGAWADTELGIWCGSAYVFEVEGHSWVQRAKLVAADRAEGDRFGISVSISGRTAVVGAYYDDDRGGLSGSAYIFEDSGSAWTETAKLLASNGTQGDWFGYSVSVERDRAIIGAYGYDGSGINSGSAYVFDLRCSPRLEVIASCPSGGPLQLSWSNATPNGQVALIYARNQGSFVVPNNRPCAGTQLGLGVNQIQVAFQGGAGEDGSRRLNASAGAGACGGFLQLLDLQTCRSSNVVAIQ